MENKRIIWMKWSDSVSTKSFSIRIDNEMLDKLHVVADYEGRSANSQVLILIRDCIERYEEKHGMIGAEGKKLKTIFSRTRSSPRVSTE